MKGADVASSRPGEVGLVRALGLPSAFCVVAGSIIGSGVFLVAADIGKAVPAFGPALSVWVVAGLFSLLGGLIFAELGAMYPGAGGQYVYFREAFGPAWAFLFSWTHTLVLCAGTLAALAVGSAAFLSGLVPLTPLQASLAATGFLLLFTIINCLGVRKGAVVLDALTWAKLAALAALIAGAATLVGSPGEAALSTGGLSVPPGATASAGPPAGAGWGISSYGIALIAAFWAYDGWQGLSQVAGEIRNPQRNLMYASALGLLAVIVLYGLMHWTYSRVLPLSAIQASGSVGVDAARAMWGDAGARALGAAILVSALGCLNGTLMTGARVTWAAAHDGAFPRSLGYLHPRFRVPTAVLVLQFAWASVLLWSGRYDQLFTYVVAAAFVFYALTAVALLRLRRRRPDAERPYRLPAGAWLAGLYLAGTVAFVVNTVIERPVESLVGFAIVALGFPAWWLTRRGTRVAHLPGREAQETS